MPPCQDLHQLPPSHYDEVMALVRATSKFVDDHFRPTKLNVACIGNQVRQMHLHIVGRSETDPAWPGTVWASDAKKPYSSEAAAEVRSAARSALSLE